MSLYYYAVDGDDIGKDLERYALLNDLDSIRLLSANVYECLDKIKIFLEGNGATIVFCAGDSILAFSERKIDLEVKNISFDAFSFSAGIGGSCCKATLALMKAKGFPKMKFGY